MQPLVLPLQREQGLQLVPVEELAPALQLQERLERPLGPLEEQVERQEVQLHRQQEVRLVPRQQVRQPEEQLEPQRLLQRSLARHQPQQFRPLGP